MPERVRYRKTRKGATRFGENVAVVWLPVNQRWAVLVGSASRPLHEWHVHYPTYALKSDAEREGRRVANVRGDYAENPLSDGAKVGLAIVGAVAVFGGLALALAKPAAAATTPKPIPPEPPPPGAVKHAIGPGDVTVQVQTNQATTFAQAASSATVNEVQSAMSQALQGLLPNASFISYLLIPGADPTQAPFLWDVAGTLGAPTTIEDVNAALAAANLSTSSGPLTVRIVPGANVPITKVSASGVVVPPGGGTFNVSVSVTGKAPTPQDFSAFFFPIAVLGANLSFEPMPGTNTWVVKVSAAPDSAGDIPQETSATEWGTISFQPISITPTT